MFVLIILSIMCFLMVFKSPHAADAFFEGLVNIRIHALAFLPILFANFMLAAMFQSVFLLKKHSPDSRSRQGCVGLYESWEKLTCGPLHTCGR